MKSKGDKTQHFNGTGPYHWSTGKDYQCTKGTLMRFFRFGVLLFVLGTLPAPRVMAVPLTTIVPGQLLISEIMANPAGDDSVQEWFEVFNPLPVAVDLNGLVVTSNNGSFTVGSGATVSSDGHFLFARSSDPAINGGLLAVDFSWGQALTLTNSGGQLALERVDGVRIAGATWAVTESGKSLELSTGTAPEFGPLDFVTNGLTQYDSTVYAPLPPSPTNFGTPGALGPDLASVSGSPTLLITEIMANPAGDETAQEWFEIYNATGDAIDLNGYTVSTATGSFTISGSPHVIPAGGLFIVARTDDPDLNGGLPRVDYAWGQALNLVNSNGELVLRAHDGTLVTRVTWTTTFDGRSQELTAGIFPEFTQTNFTPATTSYTPISPPPLDPAGRNFGTPGLPNFAQLNVIGIPPFEQSTNIPEPGTIMLILAPLVGVFTKRGRRLA